MTYCNHFWFHVGFLAGLS
uniref:Uncharacterized protein n=1 Tax=Arundo donax TaxID=35708 RepID=A0A0A9AIJ5_ARUDO